jgi:hypothetical protein
LLKSIEEPPERTIVVLVAESAVEILDTIRLAASRSTSARWGSSAAHGASSAAACPRRSPGWLRPWRGRLDRAVALTGPLAGLRDAFVDVPARGDRAMAVSLAEDSARW